MITSRQEPCRQDAVAWLTSNQWQRENIWSRADIPPVLERLVVAMAEHDYAAKEIFAVRLALEEAIVNAVRHGHQEDSGKRVRVNFLVRPEWVLLTVRDKGAGFDRRKIPDPRADENLERSCGRGLLLMQTYMTWVRFNGRGNCVTMFKCREISPAMPEPSARTNSLAEISSGAASGSPDFDERTLAWSAPAAP